MVQVESVPGDDLGSNHHGSHRNLLPSPPETAVTTLSIDAIVVPTRRSSHHLRAASDLAEDLNCTLLTLHSGKQTSAFAAQRTVPKAVDLIAIDLGRRSFLRERSRRVTEGLCLPPFETSALLRAQGFERRTDLSVKRNLSLMLSRMLGWSHVLFLDDDIVNLKADDVHQASGLLKSYDAVGLNLSKDSFPDNSVVCLAFKFSGGKQESFIGGGALMVRTDADPVFHSFFPDIYNDDWFFLLEDDRHLMPTAAVGQVTQLSHDPFKDPGRAREQELGDVLAEGIYWLLDQSISIHAADSEQHWLVFIGKRRSFINDVIVMVQDDRKITVHEKAKRIRALRASLLRLADITPALCVSYVQAWQSDREAWRRHLERLPTNISRAEALAKLTLPSVEELRWQAR